MQRVVVVTGACGHLGNTLVRMLVARGETVVGVVLPGERSRALEGVPYTRCEADLSDWEQLDGSLGEAIARAGARDAVLLHTAGIVSIATRPDETLRSVNVGGTANIIRFCQERGVCRLLYVSSVHAIPERPHSETIVETNAFDPDAVVGAYAKTKAMATALVLDAAREGLDAVVVHPSGIAGPGDYGRTHFTQLIIDAMSGRLKAYVRGGYDFVDVRDVAAGMLAAAERGQTGECYILSNRYISTEELFALIERVGGVKSARRVLPMSFARATAPLAELYYRALRQPPLYTSYSLHTLQSNSQFSHNKATRDLGYCPRPLEETLADTIDWLREQGRIKA